MASMFSASSPLSAQSLVKLRTNSNCPHSSCYLPSPSREKNSYVHLSYKNISHIESSKSSFTKGDGNFSFSLPKFPRVASTLSPSLTIIKACSGKENIYHFEATDKGTGEYIHLSDRYMGKVLLIVNIPQEYITMRKDGDSNKFYCSKDAKSDIELLNDLCRHYENKRFEVLGFLHDKKDLKGNSKEGGEEKGHLGLLGFLHHKKDPKGNSKEDHMGEEELIKFTIFEKVEVNNDHNWEINKTNKQHHDLWYFLRKTPMGDNQDVVQTIKEEFEKFLVDGTGKPMHHWPRIPTETMEDMKDGGNPGNISPGLRVIYDLRSRAILQERIDKYFLDEL